MKANGIDRMDNTKGYLPGNVTTACDRCNRGKHTMSTDQFLALAHRIVEHQQMMVASPS
jgi:hypothetical protein